MYTVKQILDKKGDCRIWCVSPETSVYDALTFMSVADIGCMIVTEETLGSVNLKDSNNKNLSRVLGILTERDYARKVVLKDRSSKDCLVKDIMSKKLVWVNQNHNLYDCMDLLNEHNIRYLPVFEDECFSSLTGIISIGDVIKSILDYKESKIKDLENYIN